MDGRFQPTGALPPEFATALARICAAEGVAVAQVRSIEIVDDEVTVRIERLGGGSRIVTYPLAILVADRPESTAVEKGTG